MIRIFKVSELIENIKITLLENFPIVEVHGEISDVNHHSRTGSIYFSLKEETYSINCACWKATASKLKDYIVEGQKVRIKGKISAYLGSSKFYIHTLDILRDGIGDTREQLLKTKLKLAQEGIFDLNKKQKITKFPKSIGLITSMDGDVIEDIKSTLRNTYPCKVFLYDTPVQGQESALKITQAINYFNSLSVCNQPSFLIIARGGGSAEDLYHFNDETLVRAIYASKIPIITAIGHQPDTSLSDLAADMSVVTPTASVAFLANISDLKINITLYSQKMLNILHRKLIQNSKNLIYVSKSLRTPKQSILHCLSRLLTLGNKLNMVSTNIFATKHLLYSNCVSKLKTPQYFLIKKKNKLDALNRLLNSFSFKEILRRGFTIIHKEGKIIKEVNNLRAGRYCVEFFDGKKDIDVN